MRNLIRDTLISREELNLGGGTAVGHPTVDLLDRQEIVPAMSVSINNCAVPKL